MKNLIRILLAIPVLWTVVYPETGFWTCAVLWLMYAHVESLTFRTTNIMGLPGFLVTFMDLMQQRFDPNRGTVEAQRPEPESKHGTGGLLVEDPEGFAATCSEHAKEAAARLLKAMRASLGGKVDLVEPTGIHHVVHCGSAGCPGTPADVSEEKVECDPLPLRTVGVHCPHWDDWKGCCFCGGGRDVSTCGGETDSV